MNQMNQNYILVPGAIILGGLILAGAIFLVRGGAPKETIGNPNAVLPVTPTDHIVGRPDAPVVVVEYSDIDCPYCKQFQQTMAQIMTEYGAEGNVAWVYRHFPIITNHQYAVQHAEASECVNALAGGDSFWRFVDALQAAAPASAQFNPANYGTVLESLGVDKGAFDQCIANGTYKKKVESDTGNALAVGAKGTPHLIILVKGSDPIPVSGALPYDAMKQVLEEALAEVK